MSYLTLPERKRAKVAAMVASLGQLEAKLSVYAREHGGRFILFGSAARGELEDGSDVDLVADFGPDGSWDAVGFAWGCAEGLGLRPDIQPYGLIGESLKERVAAEGRVLA